MKHIVLMFVGATAMLFLCWPGKAMAGLYRDSAHGNSTYGVNRSSTSTLGYVRGNCAHCHEQHASIGGSEPAPASGTPSGNLLFYDNYVSQTDGFCFECHTDSGSVQTGGGVVNRSYSYRAGSWTADPLNDVKEAFAYTTSTIYPSSSSHNLADIRAFVSNPIRASWKYSSAGNPCDACHNPHAAQGDPANAGAGPSPKTGTGGWMLSLPSQHGSSPWTLWGNDLAEKMSFYTGLYQAPYRFGGIGSGYEPDGSGTTNGANLTDFNTFCTDCHNSTNVINSTLLGRNLRTIDWGVDRHGTPTGNSATLIAPYTTNSSYVLACTDCHEPHGSPNIFLTRPEVNNGLVTVTGADQGSEDTQWGMLCMRCHGAGTPNIGNAHHSLPGWGCSVLCHPSGAYAPCTNCHYHGSTVTQGINTYQTF